LGGWAGFCCGAVACVPFILELNHMLADGDLIAMLQRGDAHTFVVDVGPFSEPRSSIT